MDLATLLQQLRDDGTIASVAQNPRAQFGTPARRYIGAELLPERPVQDNAFREESVRYRTVLANAGTRYSPTQKKGGALVGSFLVELGEHDIATELTSRDYDALLRLVQGATSMEAMAQVVDFLDITVNRALIERNEKERWDAIVNASVVRTGDNSYAETVPYSNPTGHRAAAGTAWSDPALADPFADIFAMADLLASKGFRVGRIVTSRTVLSMMAAADRVRTRVGLATITPTGQITSSSGRATLEAINGALQADGLPAIELYDLQYRTSTDTGYFLPRDVVVMVATTGREETVDLGDDEPLTLENTLGYAAIGRAAGQANSGRVLRAEHKENKPPRIEAEGWQTALPVIYEPEAIGVINSIG